MALIPGSVIVRPIANTDAPFLARVAMRLVPGPTASPREPEAVRGYFERLTPSDLTSAPGSEAYIGEIEGVSSGVISAHLDLDYFTNHSRLYVDTLAVVGEAEGRGVGRALMEFIEARARELGCREVVLDVFASNKRARQFYENSGYAADHIRMAKPLDPG